MSSLWAVSSDLYWVKVEVFVLSKQTVWFQKFRIAAKNYPMKKVSLIISSLREMDLKGKGVGGYGISQSDLLKELLIKIVWAFLSMLYFQGHYCHGIKENWQRNFFLLFFISTREQLVRTSCIAYLYTSSILLIGGIGHF